MNYALLFQGVPVPDQIDQLTKVLEQRGEGPLSESERISIKDMALLSIPGRREYAAESHRQHVSTAHDPNEFPLVRLIVTGDINDFFNHPYIRQALVDLEPAQLATLTQFFTDFVAQVGSFFTQLGPVQGPHTTWAQQIADAMTRTVINARKVLFKGLV